MNPKVSLIIPVYKVEKYLPRCLESVAAQTYDNFETILVDDGSPDNCGKMCDEYAASHENVIVIHQENQGQSAARNNGLKVAKGEYVVFSDSDDYFSDDYIEYLMTLILENNADISVGAAQTLFFGKEPGADPTGGDNVSVLSRETALKDMLYRNGFGVAPWGKCYKRSCFDGIEYPVGRIYEDLATTPKVFEKAEIIARGTHKVYFYRKRENSTMTIISEKAIDDGMNAAKEVVAYMGQKQPTVVPAANCRYAIKIEEYLPYIIKISKENRMTFKRLRNEMKPIARDVLGDKRAYWLVKVKIIAMKLGYLPTCVLIRGTEFVKHFL